jgi:HlyD family secretion protein
MSVQSLSVSGASLNLISHEFRDHVLSDETNNISKKLDFVINRGITLSNISYEYPDSEIFSLNKINLSIDVNKSTAIVGASGAGKSTLLDIILTLLKPTSGRYLIDDYELKSTDSISSLMSYVPQNIYLIDDSIASNVAFGVPNNDIDFVRLDNAIRLSSMHEFVEGLPNGADTIIGENGVQLSGGQRQRLGIARALYEDTQILVLDEATSSLDTVTERKINESILSISTIKTLIIVTHRIDSVKLCDKIIFMKNGKVENVGSYDSLLIDSPDFKDISAY